jgi:hypothetical protein
MTNENGNTIEKSSSPTGNDGLSKSPSDTSAVVANNIELKSERRPLIIDCQSPSTKSIQGNSIEQNDSALSSSSSSMSPASSTSTSNSMPPTKQTSSSNLKRGRDSSGERFAAATSNNVGNDANEGPPVKRTTKMCSHSIMNILGDKEVSKESTGDVNSLSSKENNQNSCSPFQSNSNQPISPNHRSSPSSSLPLSTQLSSSSIAQAQTMIHNQQNQSQLNSNNINPFMINPFLAAALANQQSSAQMGSPILNNISNLALLSSLGLGQQQASQASIASLGNPHSKSSSSSLVASLPPQAASSADLWPWLNMAAMSAIYGGFDSKSFEFFSSYF